MSFKLQYPYTEEERINFIVEYNHNKGLRIETVDNFVEVETSHYEPNYGDDGEIIEEYLVTDTVKENYPTYYALEANEILADGEVIIDPDYEVEQEAKRQEQFNKDFFLTSLGYIRRKVTMKTGETKDFLSDLLPVISMGVNSGQAVTIIAYKEPDFTTDVVDWESLQEEKTVTAEFISECFARLSSDFTG